MLSGGHAIQQRDLNGLLVGGLSVGVAATPAAVGWGGVLLIHLSGMLETATVGGVPRGYFFGHDSRDEGCLPMFMTW